MESIPTKSQSIQSPIVCTLLLSETVKQRETKQTLKCSFQDIFNCVITQF
eukprot:c40391_g1_i1 orf=45-194(+)